MEEKEYTIDLIEVVEIVKENWKPIVKITGGFIVAAILFLLIVSPVYESEALLQVKQKNNGGSSMMAVLSGLGSTDFLGLSSMKMGTYEEILKSRGVVIPVIEATEEKSGFFEKKYPAYEGYVEKRISTNVIERTDILQVKVIGTSPEKAQKANQLLLENFLKRMADLNSEEKGNVKKFLTERVKTAQEELNKAAFSLEKFKAEHKIISPTTNAEIFANRITEFEKQAAINRVEMEAIQVRLAAINNQLYGSGAASADNITIQRYNSELAKLEAERISYMDKYTDKHPKMIEVKDRIEQLRSKIKEEINKVATLQSPSDNEVHQKLVAGRYQNEGALAVARKTADVLEQIINQNNVELEKLPTLEREYVTLERDYRVANEIYLLLTKKLEETKIVEYQQPNNVLVVDEPTLPDRPAKPKKRSVLILAALLGFLVSSGYIVFKEMTNKTIRNAEVLKYYLELPILGIIPDDIVLVSGTEAAQQPQKTNWYDKVKEYVWKK